MSKQTSTWLEPLLTRELRRVAAPPVGYDESLRVSAPSSLAALLVCGSRVLRRLGCCWRRRWACIPIFRTRRPWRGSGRRRRSASRRWVQASTGLNVHGACRLCHADEELRAGIPLDLERSLAGASFTDAGVY